MKTILFLFAFVALYATSEAFQCYSCSLENAGCKDPFKPDAKGVTKIDCVQTDGCLKDTVELNNGTILTGRSCVSKVTPDPNARNIEVSEIASGLTNFCRTDLCNGATTMSLTVSTMIVLAAPLILRKWF